MLRSDLWVSAFVRRHNDIGHICVISRRGDNLAGQIAVEIDHLDGTISLLTPAPAIAHLDTADRLFTLRHDHVAAPAVRDQLTRELDFDSDMWVVSLEMRGSNYGLEIVK